MEFHAHIWNHHEKCIQKSTNMPGIGSIIREIAFKFQKCEIANTILLSETNARVVSVKQMDTVSDCMDQQSVTMYWVFRVGGYYQVRLNSRLCING